MANNFSKDINCRALWRFESGALTLDSRHDNTLTIVGSAGITAKTTDYKEGAACVDIEANNSAYFYINDANLDPQFPLRSTDTNKKISVAGWFKLESLPASDTGRTLYSKYDGAANKRSFMFNAYNDAGNTKLRLYLGYNSGLSYETLIHGSNLSIATWYHVTVTYDNSDKSYAIRLKDTNGNTIGTDLTGTATLDANKLSIVDVPFRIGSFASAYTWGMDGLEDELVITNDILTATEATQIAQGTYGEDTGEEDFTTYTEVDPNSHISKISGRTTFTLMHRNEDAYVYKDMGAAHFSEDFTHEFTLHLSFIEGSSLNVVWMLSNNIDDYKGHQDNSYDFLNISTLYYSAGVYRLKLSERVGANEYTNSPAVYLNEDTTYYIRVVRDEAVGTYGTLYFYIYSDAARTNLVNSGSVTLHALSDFRYIYAVNSYNSGNATYEISGYVEDSDFNETTLQSYEYVAVGGAVAGGVGPHTRRKVVSAFGGAIVGGTATIVRSQKRLRPITITGSTAGVQTNYPLPITVNYDSDMRSDYADVRFQDGSGNPLEMIPIKADGSSATWVVIVPSIPANPSTVVIYCIYGQDLTVPPSIAVNSAYCGDDFRTARTPRKVNSSLKAPAITDYGSNLIIASGEVSN
ncbi:MAG TPA: LamG-like jellyroll fold domain-containing protein, partial [Thermodesulfobacteriota bacterium]|nr:LamG-like jellyroll fold domain-containing protein [Thermodesulfobacteriota bacterium]